MESDSLQISPYIFVIAGQDEFDKIIVPAKDQAGFKAMADFPIISLKPFKAYTFVDESVMREYFDCLDSYFLYSGSIFYAKPL
jgi:hypothetical protein